MGEMFPLLQIQKTGFITQLIILLIPLILLTSNANVSSVKASTEDMCGFPMIPNVKVFGGFKRKLRGQFFFLVVKKLKGV